MQRGKNRESLGYTGFTELKLTYFILNVIEKNPTNKSVNNYGSR